MASTRREFLLRSFGAFGAAALAFERFGLLDAIAQSSDYRALVCVFLFGGSDANNVIIPNDNYAEYSAVRSSAANLGIPQASLLTVNAPSQSATFGLHPSLAGIRALWDAGKAAAVCNIGPLVEPLNRSEYINRSRRIPLNLFSHSDQQYQWQTAISNGFVSTGWAGRTADKLATINSPSTVFPVQTSMAGTPIFVTGNAERPLSLSPAPTGLNQALRLDGFPNPPNGNPRYNSLVNLLGIDDGFTIVRAANRVTGKAIQITEVLRGVGNPAVPPFPPATRTSLSNQLEQVAKIISIRGTLGINRQIFFCSIGGFDTHNNQVNGGDATLGTHAGLLTQLGDALKMFYDATVQMGVANNVVTCTMSDFSRTFKPNGSLGSDHAWGSHQFVVGGAVIGGDIYGVPGPNGKAFPALSPAGPDDTDSGSNARGRWIPTTSIDQYGATLAKWLGVSNTDLPAVFPGIGNFGPADLGFLG